MHIQKFYPKQTPIRLDLDPKQHPIYLDHVYVFKNEGDFSRKIPRHWHYIGFGLSDLTGACLFYRYDEIMRKKSEEYDKQVERIPHRFPLQDGNSGFGFELTFRLKCLKDEDWSSEPPKWPASNILQKMAKFLYQNPQNRNLSPGDRIQLSEWLDPDDDDPPIVHIILTEDRTLPKMTTIRGSLNFIQLVGLHEEELQLARKWSSEGILRLMRNHMETGGELLVTDMSREYNLLELDGSHKKMIEQGSKESGSDTIAMYIKYSASSSLPEWFKSVEDAGTGDSIYDEEADSPSHSTEPEDINDDEVRIDVYKDCDEIEDEEVPLDSNWMYGGAVSKGVERGNLRSINKSGQNKRSNDDDFKNERTKTNNKSFLSMTSNISHLKLDTERDIKTSNLDEQKQIDSLYLLLSCDDAKNLLTMLKYRLSRGKYFLLTSDHLWTAFIIEGSPSLEKSPVSVKKPFVKIDKDPEEIYLCISEALLQNMIRDLEVILKEDEPNLPKNLSWQEHKLYLTVVDDLLDD